MPKPESTENLVSMISDLRSRVDRSEHRDAFGDKRRLVAASGGITATPVPLTALDTLNRYTLTASYVDLCMFLPAASGVLTVHALGNSATAGQFDFQLYHPASATTLVTSDPAVVFPPTGTSAKATTGWTSLLASAPTLYEATVVLRARYLNAANNRLTIMSARWGVTNV